MSLSSFCWRTYCYKHILEDQMLVNKENRNILIWKIWNESNSYGKYWPIGRLDGPLVHCSPRKLCSYRDLSRTALFQLYTL